MAKYQEFCFQRTPRSEKSDQRAPDQLAELDHRAEFSLDSQPPANRIGFPIGTGVPTVGESVPGYEAGGWQGVCAPSTTPTEIVERLNRTINAALADAKSRTRLAELGGQPFTGTPAEFGEFIAAETDKWAKVVREADLKPD